MNLPQPDSADTLATFLGGHDDQSLVQVQSAWQILLRPADVALIHLDPAGEHVASWADHGAAQPVQHRPGGLVPAQTKHLLQAQGAGTVLLRYHPPHGLKPKPKRDVGVLKDGSRSDRNLMPAITASQQHRSNRRTPLAAAMRANKALKPAQLPQVLPASLVARKPVVELPQVPWVVLHPAKYYGLWLGESSG